MQSKTSFFNRTLFRKNLTRFWPLWGMASFAGSLFPLALLLQLMRRENFYMWNSPLDFTEMYYNVAAYGVPVISLLYAVLCAMMVWSYLYNSRSVGMMHTLPIRREGLFFTNFLSGMAMMLAAWDKRYYDLSHRDILGAFMGTGCKREALGDIVFVPEGAQLVVEKALLNYLSSNLTQIGAAPITLTEIPREELLQKEEKVKVINATVADLRLDAVAAAGYGVSRSRMADEIKSLNVKVNWQEAKKAAQPVKEGDVLSFRGRGRVEVAEIRGTTKKGRISITLKRYI